MISQMKKFTQNDMEEYLQLSTEAYAANNPLMTLNIVTAEELRNQTKQMVKDFMEGAEVVNKKLSSNVIFNHLYRIDGVLVKTNFCCEIHHFLKYVVRNEPHNPYYQELSKFDWAQYPEGTAVLAVRQVTNLKYQNYGLTRYSLIQKSKHLVSQGYIYMFYWIVNPITLKIVLTLGAVVMKEVDIEINKKPLKTYFLKCDMRIAAQMSNARATRTASL